MTKEQERVQKYKARIGDSSQARYAGSLFTLPFFCTVLWTPTKRATPDTSAARPISAARRLERREASYRMRSLSYCSVFMNPKLPLNGRNYMLTLDSVLTTNVTQTNLC